MQTRWCTFKTVLRAAVTETVWVRAKTVRRKFVAFIRRLFAWRLLCHEIAEFILICLRSQTVQAPRIHFDMLEKPNSASTEMLQEAQAVSPFARLRDRTFEAGFFSVALIAMAGWVYFITLLLVRLSLWFFS